MYYVNGQYFKRLKDALAYAKITAINNGNRGVRVTIVKVG